MKRRQRHLPAALFETALFLAIVTAVSLYVLWEGGFQPTDRLYIREWQTHQTCLKKILRQREITLITLNTTQSYYIDRDQVMGFEYDLAKAFATYLGVDLQVVVADSREEMLTLLKETPTAFIAAGLEIPAYADKAVAYSTPYMHACQYIIVHRDNLEIKSPSDLAGHPVHIGQDSSCRELLEKLRADGVDMDIVFDSAVTEELLRRVAENIIDVTIAKRHVALFNRRYYPQISLREKLSDQCASLGWVVNTRAEGLLKEINRFLSTIMEDGRFQEIYDRYYADAGEFDFVDLRAFHRRIKSRLPQYQSIIQSAAEASGFDWRLIAAQMYQESHYDPKAKSHAQAYGLMQLTQKTADHFGVTDIYDPEQNITAGIKHMKRLYDYFEKAEGTDRICLTLAAYNIGQGHMLDAYILAQKRQLDPYRWESISETLPLLRQPEYYRKSIYGFCRGEEPVAYVKQTLLYYDILKYQDMPWAEVNGENSNRE